MESAWDDTVLVEAFDAAIAKYQVWHIPGRKFKPLMSVGRTISVMLMQYLRSSRVTDKREHQHSRMREVLSKRKSCGHQSREEVANKQDGLCGNSLQDGKQSAIIGQKNEDTMFVAEEAVETNHQLQKGAEGQTYYFGSKHERLPSATEKSWQQQQLQNLEDQQEEIFKQLYHVATYMFRSGASAHHPWG